MSQTRGRLFQLIVGLAVGSVAPTAIGPSKAEAAVTHEEVERAIREGVRFLLKEQKENGSWKDFDQSTKTGLTSLITLALLTAGEKPDSPAIRKAVAYLRGFSPEQLDSTYAISLQTMVFAAVDPKGDSVRIVANVDWLERAQIPAGAAPSARGSWTYGLGGGHGQAGDNSNSQYALLGLHAASEVGVGRPRRSIATTPRRRARAPSGRPCSRACPRSARPLLPSVRCGSRWRPAPRITASTSTITRSGSTAGRSCCRRRRA